MNLLFSAIVLLNVATAAFVATSRRWTPPDIAAVFALTQLAFAATTLLWLFRNRPRLSRVPLGRINVLAGTLVGAGLLLGVAYGVVLRVTVIEHSFDPEPLYMPLWTSGQLKSMIDVAGGRYAAVERYGPFAIIDAVQRMPTSLVTASTGLLWVLYEAAALLLTSALTVLSLRGIAADGKPIHLLAVAGGRSQPHDAGTSAYDVFLCHNSADTTEIREIAHSLAACGLNPWFDDTQLGGGSRWQDEISDQIIRIPCAAVFVGSFGVGPWQRLEIQALLQEFVDRRCTLIPVILASAPAKPDVPVFLRGLTWIDFRKSATFAESQLCESVRRVMVRRQT